MATRNRTWVEKRDQAKVAEVSVLDRTMLGQPAGARMLISTPSEIDQCLRAIPRGTSVTIAELRQSLARAAAADFTCPLTTGIFLRIVGEAAMEERASGRPDAEITPFWRAIGPKDALRKRFSFDPAFIDARRAEEGI